MAKVNLTFDWYEERVEALAAMNGMDFVNAISQIDEKLHHLAKHEEKEFISIDDMRRMLRDETEGIYRW